MAATYFPEVKLKSLLSDALAVVRDMRRANFDLLIAEAFRVQGFSVTEVQEFSLAEVGGPGAPDLPDLSLVKGGKKFCVQSRHWQDTAIDVGAVHELERIMADRGADGGFLVTAGGVTADAAACALPRRAPPSNFFWLNPVVCAGITVACCFWQHSTHTRSFIHELGSRRRQLEAIEGQSERAVGQDHRRRAGQG